MPTRTLNIHRRKNYCLGVYGGRTIGNESVEMVHGQVYSIKLENHYSYYANVELKVDGSLIGTFFLRPYEKLEVERPVDLARKFTFYKLGLLKQTNRKYGIKSTSSNGLIEAHFTPVYKIPDLSLLKYNNFGSNQIIKQKSKNRYDNEGVTAFTLPSRQRFKTLDMYEFDKSRRITLSILLVAEPEVEPEVEHHHNETFFDYYEYPNVCWHDNPYYNMPSNVQSFNVQPPNVQPLNNYNSHTHKTC